MPPPVFGFLAFTSGSYEGAIIRDMRLANALHRRGHRVVVYWMMDRNPELLDAGIPQRMLCFATRYQFRRPCDVMDHVGRGSFILPARMRREFAQHRPQYVDRLMGNLCHCICDGGHSDPGLVGRLVNFMRRDGVTHLLPTFAMLCPFALAAKQRGGHAFDYLPTFQGEEIFANYAQRLGRLGDYHQRLREAVAGSPWPAVAVSHDYVERISQEMGIEPSRLRAIHPGIELPANTLPPPFEVLKPKFPHLDRALPIVTYIGRQDSEKGIDLLLYAAKILETRGIRMHLVICGGSSFGQRYRDVLMQIAEHLRLPTHHRRRVPVEMRDALYAYSRCIVYPSIHREPFGMVAAEAMARGTPVIVPDIGGITEVIRSGDRAGGLTFKSWDSSDLANQLQRILTDDALYESLRSNTRALAGQFSIDRMTDRVLEHLGIDPPPRSPIDGASGSSIA